MSGIVQVSPCSMLRVNFHMIELVSRHVSPLLVDRNGDTPLHLACSEGNYEAVVHLLTLNPPILLRNNLGKTPRDVVPAYYSGSSQLQIRTESMPNTKACQEKKFYCQGSD